MSHTPERRANISEALKGRTLSDEHRANLSKAAKAAWARRRVYWAVQLREGAEFATIFLCGAENLANAYRSGFLHGARHACCPLAPGDIVVGHVEKGYFFEEEPLVEVELPDAKAREEQLEEMTLGLIGKILG